MSDNILGKFESHKSKPLIETLTYKSIINQLEAYSEGRNDVFTDPLISILVRKIVSKELAAMREFYYNEITGIGSMLMGLQARLKNDITFIRGKNENY